MDVTDLISRIVDRYGTARLYTDRGKSLYRHDHSLHWIVQFETAFERPNHFSFAFTFEATEEGEAKPYRYARRIQTEGERVRMGDPEWQPGYARSLESAVATLTGVSYGTAHIVPRLLIPDRVSGRTIFEGRGDPVLNMDEQIDGESHHVIELRRETRVMRVLVAAATLTIRRIEEHAEGRSARFDYQAVLTA